MPSGLGLDNSQSPANDPHTLSNYHDVRTQRMEVDAIIHFSAHKLVGQVTHYMVPLKSESASGPSHIVLDTSWVDVSSVKVNGEAARWELAARKEPYGSPLSVEVKEEYRAGKELKVDISFSTTDKCTALQWLTPAQTPGGKHPYMFSQCQAIHARSIFPCQDTPAVKTPITFSIRSPLPALASGLPTGARDFQPGDSGAPGSLLYTFEQSIPIPAYLFAVASGDIASAAIGPRSSVWSDSVDLLAVQKELERDVETMIQTAERLIFAYPWTQYNVLILPASFPYGGMENPVFTYATPTIISGDRENVDVIAHELAHSWSGNLVSNASWEHFWLNEGWTRYMERRIIGALRGESHHDFSAILGWKALQADVADFGAEHEFTKLVPDLRDRDPDDAFSVVPYEKGYHFLYYLERLFGREAWDKFIPHYFTKYQKKALDSFEFKATVLAYFSAAPGTAEKLAQIDWHTWLHQSGLPPKPDFDTSLADVCYALADKWQQRARSRSKPSSTPSFEPSSLDITDWGALQSALFLDTLIQMVTADEGASDVSSLSATPLLPAEDVRLMGYLYGYLNSRNVEVLARYLRLGLLAQERKQSAGDTCDQVWKGDFRAPAVALLSRVGRMKYVRPLFRALTAVDRQLAIDTLQKNRDFYHPICLAMVEKDLANSKDRSH